MKKVVILCLVGLFSIYCSGQSKKNNKEIKKNIPSKIKTFLGNYQFGECFGKTAGGTSICFEFNLSVFIKNAKLRGEFKIYGFQTIKHYYCSTKILGKYVYFYYHKYGKENIYPDRNLKKSHALFRLKNKGHD